MKNPLRLRHTTKAMRQRKSMSQGQFWRVRTARHSEKKQGKKKMQKKNLDPEMPLYILRSSIAAISAHHMLGAKSTTRTPPRDTVCFVCSCGPHLTPFFGAAEPLPILKPSNFVPKNGFPVVKGLTRVLRTRSSRCITFFFCFWGFLDLEKVITPLQLETRFWGKNTWI